MAPSKASNESPSVNEITRIIQSIIVPSHLQSRPQRAPEQNSGDKVSMGAVSKLIESIHVPHHLLPRPQSAHNTMMPEEPVPPNKVAVYATKGSNFSGRMLVPKQREWDSAKTAKRLKNSQSHRDHQLAKVKNHVESDTFRQSLRLRDNLKKARSPGPSSSRPDRRSSDAHRHMPSLELGIAKGERRRSKVTGCDRCSNIPCQERQHAYRLLGVEPVVCLKVLEWKAQWGKDRHDSFLTGLAYKHREAARLLRTVHNLDALSICTICKGRTGFYPEGLACKCRRSVGEQALEGSLRQWLQVALRKTKGDSHKRENLQQGLQYLAKASTEASKALQALSKAIRAKQAESSKSPKKSEKRKRPSTPSADDPETPTKDGVCKQSISPPETSHKKRRLTRDCGSQENLPKVSCFKTKLQTRAWDLKALLRDSKNRAEKTWGRTLFGYRKKPYAELGQQQLTTGSSQDGTAAGDAHRPELRQLLHSCGPECTDIVARALELDENMGGMEDGAGDHPPCNDRDCKHCRN